MATASAESELSRAMSPCGHTTGDHHRLLAAFQRSQITWATLNRGARKPTKQPEPPECLLPAHMRKQRFGNARMTTAEAASWLGWDTADLT